MRIEIRIPHFWKTKEPTQELTVQNIRLAVRIQKKLEKEVTKCHENIEEREPAGLPKKSTNIQGGEAESECEVFKPI